MLLVDLVAQHRLGPFCRVTLSVLELPFLQEEELTWESVRYLGGSIKEEEETRS